MLRSFLKPNDFNASDQKAKKKEELTPWNTPFLCCNKLRFDVPQKTSDVLNPSRSDKLKPNCDL